jgi:hypothetical protein
MSVLRLSAGGVSFRHRSCVVGHGPGIRVVIQSMLEFEARVLEQVVEQVTKLE